MQVKPILSFRQFLLLFAICTISAWGCENLLPLKSETETETVQEETIKTSVGPGATSSPVKGNVHVAFAGGGWRAHTGHSAWVISLLDGNRKLQNAFKNVATIGSNSGGSWFNTMLTMSPEFNQQIEDSSAFSKWGTPNGGWLGKQHAIFDNAPEICKFIDKIPYELTLCVAKQHAGTDRNWADIVSTVVYNGYPMQGKTLASRQPWAAGKSLLLAGSLLKTNVLLNELSGAKQYYLTCHSPSEPDWYDYQDKLKGFKCTGDKPYYPVSPVIFSDIPDPALTKPPFFASLTTNALYVLYAQHKENGTDPRNAIISNPINQSGLFAIDAAIASSAAVGFEAYVRKNDILDSWLAAYEMRNLAPAFSLKGSAAKFVSDLSNQTVADMAKEQILRIADGGAVDNSAVAQIVKFLQLNKQADGFNIVAFDNTIEAFMPKDENNAPAKTAVGPDIAFLFGQGLCSPDEFCTFSCDVAPIGCIEVPEQQIFETDALLTTDYTWEASEGNMKLIYTQYPVTTIDSPTFNIKAGSKGTLHAFSCIAPDAGTVPSTTKLEGYYEMFKFIHDALKVKNDQGLKYLEHAFGLNGN